MFNKKTLLLALLITLGAMATLVYAAPAGPFAPEQGGLAPFGVSSPDTEPCSVGDQYETAGGGSRDDSFATASTLTTDGQPGHTFDRWMDKDWATFEAEAGVTYSIATTNLSPAYDPDGKFTDTVLELYASDGLTLLDESDDYGGNNASRLDWTATQAGTLYVKV